MGRHLLNFAFNFAKITVKEPEIKLSWIQDYPSLGGNWWRLRCVLTPPSLETGRSWLEKNPKTQSRRRKSYRIFRLNYGYLGMIFCQMYCQKYLNKYNTEVIRSKPCLRLDKCTPLFFNRKKEVVRSLFVKVDFNFARTKLFPEGNVWCLVTIGGPFQTRALAPFPALGSVTRLCWKAVHILYSVSKIKRGAGAFKPRFGKRQWTVEQARIRSCCF